MARTFLEAVEYRRSIYGIGKDASISSDEAEHIVQRILKAAPSAFNSQSARVVLLWGAQSDRLWDLVKETLRGIIPAERFADTAAKLAGFSAGLGTILFFEEQGVVEGLQKQFPTYWEQFPVWSLQSSGMLQFAVWTALEDSGYGASLQHYNPLIDEEVKKLWKLPEGWKLLSQMPFGVPTVSAEEKEVVPLEFRLKVFKE